MNASCAISLFFVSLLTVICTVAEAVSDEEDGSDVKALDAYRTSSLRPSDGYLVDWSVIGPFSIKEESGIGFAAIDVGAVSAVDSVQHAGREYFWTYVIVKNGAAVVDLSREFGSDAKGIAYAAAEVYVNRDVNATIRVETREKVACWLNGEAITLAPDAKSDDRVYGSPVRLRFGYNKIIIRFRHGRGKWSFSARLLDEAGEPIDRKRLRILDDGVGFVPAKVPLEIRGGSDILLELHRP